MSPRFYVGIVAACFSCGAYSYQISPNPNDWHSIIKISTNDAENSADFLNSGEIFIENGVLQNNGVLTNSAGTYWQQTAQILNRAKMVNWGVLNNENRRGPLSWQSSYAVLRNEGWLDNYGTLNNSGSMYLTGRAGSLYLPVTYNHEGATLNNRGGILVDSFVELNNNGGVINNDLPGSSMTINPYGKFYNTGVINNSGRIDVASTGASLLNLGRINNAGQLSGGWNNHEVGSIVNAVGGTLSADGHNGGLVHNQGGVVLNENVKSFFGAGRYVQSAGKTLVYGDFSQQSIDIQGGDLSGSGNVKGHVTISRGATLSLDGNHDQGLSVDGDLTSGGDWFLKIHSINAAVGLSVNGDVLFDGGSINVDFVDAFSPSAGQYWDLFRAHRIVGLDGLNWHLNGLADGLKWNIRQLDSGEVRLSIGVVPEPDEWALVLSGLVLVPLMRRMRSLPMNSAQAST